MGTRIELFDENIEKPLLRITVPGNITKDQLKKELRVAVTLIVDLGDKKKRTTVPIKIFDEELKSTLEKYIETFSVVLTRITTEEEVEGEFKLSDIPTE